MSLGKGVLDKEMLRKYPPDKWKKCSRGHLNSPNAEICWICGEEL